MQDRWFGDNRDLVKWGAVSYLSNQYPQHTVCPILYYTKPPGHGNKNLGLKHSNGTSQSIGFSQFILNIFPSNCFLYYSQLSKGIKLSWPLLALNSENYLQDIIKYMNNISSPCIVFLDPDTGIEPSSGGNNKHARKAHIKHIWDNILKKDDILAIYQHISRGHAINNYIEIFESSINAQASYIINAQASYIMSDGTSPLLAKDAAVMYAIKP